MAAPASPKTDFVSAVETRPYVSWPAVFAGNAVAGGLILVMLPLGAAAGLAMTSAYSADSASGGAIGWAAIFWLAFMYLFSISAGGYVVGRIRPRVDDATPNEVRFRDGINGLVFWGVGMILSAMLTFLTVTSVVGKVTNAAGQAMGGAVSTAANAVPTLNIDYISDVLLRSSSNSQSGTAPRSDTDVRAEIGRILTSSAASGQIGDQDRQYLATLVAQRAGLSETDAKTRIDEGIKRANELKDQALAKAQAAAEAARKAASRAAFWTAVLSLLSGVAAVLAARAGGQHRDANRF